MFTQPLPKVNFTAGELSPWLDGRLDTESVSKGASFLENMLVTPFGGLKRRTGTQLIDGNVPREGSVRLMTFSFSVGDQLIMEFSRGLIRYFQDDGLLKHEDGTPVTTKTPWTSDDALENLRMQQLNDVIYIVCPSTPPHILQRYGMDDWRLGEITFKTHPSETNIGGDFPLNFRPDYSGSDAEVYIESPEDIFDKSMENNELIRISIIHDETLLPFSIQKGFPVTTLKRTFGLGDKFYRELATGWTNYYTCIKPFDPSNYIGFDTPESYPSFFRKGTISIQPFPVWGAWTFQTAGTWDASWALEKSNEDPTTIRNDLDFTWHCSKTLIQDDSHRQNYSLSGDEREEVLYQLFLLSVKTGGTCGSPEFRRAAAKFDYLMKIVKVDDAKHAWANYMRPLQFIPIPKGSSSDWSFCAFGRKNGYPSCVEFHQGRLWLASTRAQPQTLWASGVDDLHHFATGAEADSPISLTLAASQQNKICWLSSLRGLTVGTAEGEWTLQGSDNNPLSGLNASFERQSGIGSAPIDAMTVENSLYFIQQGNGKVREFSYSLESDGFISSDAGLLAEHILNKGIIEWAHQKAVALHLWCVLKDGQLACLTVNKSQGILAWHRHRIAGANVISIACKRGAATWEDDVWIVVERTVNGQNIRSIERMGGRPLHADGFVIRETSGGMLSRLEHLAGMPVILHPIDHSDESIRGTVSSDGTLLLPSHAGTGKWLVGLPFTSTMTTMPMETAEIQGTIKTSVRAKLLLLESGLEFDYGNGDEQDWIPFEKNRFNFEHPRTGYISLTIHPHLNQQPKLAIKTDGAEALNILAIIPELVVTG